MADWSFARRPFWVFTHVFVGSWVILCLVAMAWQLDRLGERRAVNEVVEARAFGEPASIQAATDRPVDELDYQAVAGPLTWTDPEVARIGPRSRDGAAGEWVVGAADLPDGTTILVLRGFVELGSDEAADAAPAPADASVEVTGWLRATERQEFLGRVDDGGALAPRMDVDALAARLDGEPEVAPVWLQLGQSVPASPLAPVDAPVVDEGPHRSYAVQWAVFALLTIIVYAVMLRRRATGTRRAVEEVPA